MGKLESLTTVKRQLKAEFGKQTTSLNCIRDVFERFTETGTVEDRERSRRPSVITEETVEKVHYVCEAERRQSIRNNSSCLCHPKDHSASNYERAFIAKTIQGTFCSTVVRRRFSRSGGHVRNRGADVIECPQ